MTSTQLPDVQSQSFVRMHVPLFAGIDQVKARLWLADIGECVGSVKLAAAVPEGKRGVHMSRLYREFLGTGSEAVALDSTLPHRIERTAIAQESHELSVTVGGEFVIARLSPATASQGLHPFKLSVTAQWKNGAILWSTRMQGVALLGCPCSKALSQEAGFHNQRAVITVEVAGLQTSRVQDLLDAIDQSASSPVYPVLRREDEKELIDAIARSDRYRFVEDAGSVLWESLFKAGFTGTSIHVRSLESIHAHDAIAWAGPSGESLGMPQSV
jgi:GTP cyclohydrolase IB